MSCSSPRSRPTAATNGRRFVAALGLALALIHSPVRVHGQPEQEPSVGSSDLSASTSALAAAMTAIRTADRIEVERLRGDLLERGQSRCVGGKPRLVIRCYVELATVACGGERRKGSAISTTDCMRIADVIATNLLGESSFVSPSKRARLVETSEVFRRALDAELERQYARLALEMLAKSDLARGQRGASAADPSATREAVSVHRFCTSRGQAGQLSYQRCAAALVWFTSIANAASPLKVREEASTP